MRQFLYVKFNTCENLYQWGYLYNVRQIISLLKWKSSKKTNPLKILMMQKFSLFKDFFCRIKRYTFLKILVSRTMPPPIKFLPHKMIQSNHFVTFLIVPHFIRVSALCRLFIFVSPKYCKKKFSKFSPAFLLVLWSYSLKKAFWEVFLQLKISSVLHLLLVYSLALYL